MATQRKSKYSSKFLKLIGEIIPKIAMFADRKLQKKNNFSGQRLERWIFKTIPSGSIDQTNASRGHYSSIAVDIRTIIQSTALRMFTDCNAILYLCNRWHAGRKI